MINNRQAGRRRGRGGQQQRPQGGGSGRPDNGNRIDNRARGNAAQLLEKYKTLARDAQMQGDRVNVEYYLQFADHYFRVLAETRARFEENGGQSQGRRPQGATLDEDEQDYEDEGDRGAPTEPQRASEQGRGQDGYRTQDGVRDGQRDGGDRSGNERNGNDRSGNDRSGNDRNGNQGSNGYAGNGQQREPSAGQREAQRDDRPRGRVNGNGGDPREAENGRAREQREDYVRPPQREPRPETERAEAYQPAAYQLAPFQPAPQAAPDGDAEPPRRGRGRPRRVPAEAPAFEAEDRLPELSLPPALNLSASVGSDGDDASVGEEKPRRRRGRPPANATVE